MTKIKVVFQKILSLASTHKVWASVIAVALIFGGYSGYKKIVGVTSTAQYALAAVERGTISTYISGSGQVAALQQVDVKSKVSGDVTYVGIKAGQEVRAGQIIAYLSSRDAQKAVRDAQISLESAQIDLEKLRNNQQADSVTTAEDLGQGYRDAYNKVSDAFLSMPNIVDITRGVLYDNTLLQSINIGGCSPNVCEYGNFISEDIHMEFKALTDRAEQDYKTAREAYDPNFQFYRSIRLDASPEEINSILSTTAKTVELMAQAIKSEQNMLDTLVSNINDTAAKKEKKAQIPQQITQYQSDITSAIGKLNGIISNLANAQTIIKSNIRSLEDKTLSNPLDIVSQENTVSQRQATLQDAKDSLANYSIRASFAGNVTKVNVKVGDSISGSTVLTTLLTKQSIADISLNEVDISQVKVSQKVTLTFDAIENLTIAGSVLEVDSLGTTSQGVVTYGVVIGFDTQDQRVKPGMNVSATIITNIKQDVLMVPNSAVKTAGGVSYVEIPQDQPAASKLLANGITSAGIVLPTSPQRQTVEIGLSNDLTTEITSGLKEGDLVVSRTITSSTTSTSSTTQNRTSQQGNGIFSIPGAAGGRAIQGR